ncbi:T9SS type A sorting domain-containing protein [Hymenobacter wooponensis]|uniref:T9SS type A sorting domain-containing protein n=1 Tax=Hymenobacter wooponensis TaxID=1525360 RepID=A0A4Z0MJM8_9BACT|nr:T9SS type A sorting domain-containing protein [Hymenobacter wooponensis]TGD79721.1 T9SS type A sorting domain-containing protein [Hymenobacter wooponensis]
MKNSYMSTIQQVLRPHMRLLLLLLLALPFTGLAQTVTITPVTPGNPQNFGSIPVGQFSSSNSYTVSASGITQNVTVVIPNGFQGSINNVTFGTSNLNLTRSGNSLSTTIYLRFAPTEETDYNASLYATSQGGNTPVFSNFINVVGIGTAGTPNIVVNPEALVFGTQLINTKSASKSVSVTATALTEAITVTPSLGYEVSLDNSNFTSVVTLPATNGAVSTTLYVRFAPTEKQPYTGFLTLTSAGATDRKVDLFGTGDAPATLTVNPTSLSFPDTNVGLASAIQSFTVNASYLNGSVTITPPNNFQIRLPSGTFSTASITIPFTGTPINQVIEARFQPASNGNKSGGITIASPNVTTATVAVSGQATQPSNIPTITANPTALDFGQISGSGSAQVLTFEVGATGLNAPLVLTPSNTNIALRDLSAGGSLTRGPLTINPVNGIVSIRTIEVQLVDLVAQGNFSGTITASSTGATSRVINLTGVNNTTGESVINPSRVNLSLFSTVPGVPSAVQSYTVTGTNLLRDITITAPQFFQVSLDDTFSGITTTGNSITVVRNSGTEVTAVTVYVRFFPSSALVVSSSIANVSSPARTVAIRVQGTSEPSVILQDRFQPVTNIVLNKVSASQAITVVAERVLQPITISKLLSADPTFNPSNISQFEFSRDNVTFTSDTLMLTPNASTYSINRSIYVRYRPTNLGPGTATLQFQSNDFDNKGVQSFQSNSLLSGLPIDVEPTLRSTASVVRSGATATVTFNLPANYAALGYGEGRLIVASTNATLPASNQPADGVSYTTGNQTYGQGPQVAPGYFAVYAGPNATATIDGLDPATTYYFFTFEFNNIDNVVNVIASGAENYLSPPVPTVIEGIIAPGTPLPVTLVSFTAKLRNKQVALDWKTATEKNNGMFYVERSQDARTYTSILSRAGQGSTEKATSYSAIDAAPLAGTSYYRLKQVDFDGTTSYSSPVAVTNAGSAEVSMYPNPAEDILNIQLAGSTEGVRATITDLSGRVIRTEVLRADGQLNVRDLRNGTYLVTVGEGNAKITQRIVKK